MSTDVHPAWCNCTRCQHPAPASTIAGRVLLMRILVATVAAEVGALIMLAILFFTLR